MSELDAANAAPPASDTERKSALGWIAVIAVLGVIALVIAGVYSYKSHKAEVAKIESAPVELPPLVKPVKEKMRKSATKKIADKATNTPATAEFVPEVVITVNDEQSTVVIKPEVMRTWGEHPVPPLPPSPLN